MILYNWICRADVTCYPYLNLFITGYPIKYPTKNPQIIIRDKDSKQIVNIWISIYTPSSVICEDMRSENPVLDKLLNSS